MVQFQQVLNTKRFLNQIKKKPKRLLPPSPRKKETLPPFANFALIMGRHASYFVWICREKHDYKCWWVLQILPESEMRGRSRVNAWRISFLENWIAGSWTKSATQLEWRDLNFGTNHRLMKNASHKKTTPNARQNERQFPHQCSSLDERFY